MSVPGRRLPRAARSSSRPLAREADRGHGNGGLEQDHAVVPQVRSARPEVRVDVESGRAIPACRGGLEGLRIESHVGLEVHPELCVLGQPLQAVSGRQEDAAGRGARALAGVRPRAGSDALPVLLDGEHPGVRMPVSVGHAAADGEGGLGERESRHDRQQRGGPQSWCPAVRFHAGSLRPRRRSADGAEAEAAADGGACHFFTSVRVACGATVTDAGKSSVKVGPREVAEPSTSGARSRAAALAGALLPGFYRPRGSFAT